ncbi:hypothetical protein OC835_000649 [Tilletia horrida]|nr:hypothetical protein OC835_000649 [Tilletia horrida]
MSAGRGFETRLRGKQFYERHWSTSTNSTARSTTTSASSTSSAGTRHGAGGNTATTRRKSGMRHVPSPTTKWTNPCPPPPAQKTPKSPMQAWNSPTLSSTGGQFATGSDSAPSSPMLTGTPVFQSAPSSPMLQSSEWSSSTTAPPSPVPTATETADSGMPFGAGPTPPPNAEDAAGPPPETAHSNDSTTMLIAGTSALGALLLICALLWALIVRAKRGQRRKHLAEVLEKVGTSPSTSSSDMSRKDSFGNVGLFSPTEWDDLAEKAIGLPSATSDVTLQKDASFCWKYPTLSIPPAAARAMTETHYVKRRSTIPARPRSEAKAVRIDPAVVLDPPLRDPLAEPYHTEIRIDADAESLVTEDDGDLGVDVDPEAEHGDDEADDHEDEDDDDGPPAWLVALAGMDSNLATFPPLTESISAPSTSAASDSDARKGWLNFVIPPVRRTSGSGSGPGSGSEPRAGSTAYNQNNSHVSLAPTLRSLASVYSTPGSPQLPPMVVPSITITVDDGDFGIVDRPLSLIEERGYDSESAEGCLDPDEFPTIPRWESQLRRF